MNKPLREFWQRLKIDTGGTDNTQSRSFRLFRYVWPVRIVWTAIIAASLAWNMATVRQNTLEAARIQARVAYEKDVIYRRWNTGHGGIYAPVTKETQPNPYLSDIPERDITTPSGRLLTLINPAYMTRQVHELAEDEYGVRGHITSLEPIRPENAPDAWETEALRTFERGEIEVNSVAEIDGREYMRLMRPLLTEQGCLMCHAAQGYQVGDIRGGISVSIPMEPLWAVSRSHMLFLALSHGLLWLMGLGVTVVVSRRLARSVTAREALEEEVAERVRVEEALKQYVERLRVLREIDQAILETRSLEETAQAALRHVRQLVPCQGASVTLFDFDVGEATVFATHINHESSLDEGARFPLEWFRPLEALREGKVHMIEDILTVPQPTPAERALQDEGLHSHVSVPLIAQSELIGSLNLGADAPAAFADEQIEIAREVASQLAVALRQARLHEQVQRHAKELEQRVAERTAELEAEIAERIQAEEELRLFRYLIDQSHDLVFVIDPETSRFLDVNETACRATGYTREELLEMSVTDLEAVIPTHVTWQQRVEQIKKGGTRKEGRHKRKDGTTYPVEADSSFVTFGGRDYVLAMLRDTTERKQAEEALRESESKFRAIVQDQTEFIVRCLPDTTRTFVNESYCRHMEKSPDDLIGTRSLDELPDRDRQRVQEKLASLTPDEPVATDEYSYITPDGEELWESWTDRGIFDENDQLVEVQSVGRDITQRKLDERALRLRDAALEAAANAITITDRDGNITWVNPAFTRLTGYTLEEAVGNNPRLLQSGQHDKAFYKNLWDTVLSGNVWHGEIINKRKDGSLYTEEMTITPLRNESGESSHFIAIKQDITPRKQTEEELRRRTEELEMFNKVMVDREMRIIEMKEEVNKLCEELSREPAYPPVWQDSNDS
jgi:PAS domain S-box-containing protein